MPRNECPNYPDNILNDISDFEYLSKEQKEKLLDWCLKQFLTFKNIKYFKLDILFNL